MRFDNPVPVTTIAQLIGAELIGNIDGYVTGINELHKVEFGDLAFVDHPKYYSTCINSAATFIIINTKTYFPEGKALLVVDDPFEAYQKIVSFYRPFTPSLKMISESASIGAGSVIMPGAYIGNHVSIGSNCIVHPNVTILDHCIIGDHVIIQAGSVIGSDAFYYNKKTNREIHYKKMASCGRVLIENAVEIGANCTIDRGVSHDTIIGAGTKWIISFIWA
jgi:UDP-3-O-[3-hydroxymyristoyl] glucosamine N-acyltransferase